MSQYQKGPKFKKPYRSFANIYQSSKLIEKHQKNVDELTNQLTMLNNQIGMIYSINGQINDVRNSFDSFRYYIDNLKMEIQNTLYGIRSDVSALNTTLFQLNGFSKDINIASNTLKEVKTDIDVQMMVVTGLVNSIAEQANKVTNIVKGFDEAVSDPAINRTIDDLKELSSTFDSLRG